MNAVEFACVNKTFRHRASFFGLLGSERSGETRALREISFIAQRGETVAILGPNGSGKTTLLKLISTTLLPDAGSVTVAGFSTHEQEQEVREQVGFAIANERSFFPRLTATENLEYFAALENIGRRDVRSRINTALSAVGLTAASDIWVAKYSSGMLQRLGIARAILKSPRILLLDEPTRSLDLQASADFHQRVRELGRSGTTVLLATHSFEEAALLAHRVLILRKGELVENTAIKQTSVEELRDRYLLLQSAPGEPVPTVEAR